MDIDVVKQLGEKAGIRDLFWFDAVLSVVIESGASDEDKIASFLDDLILEGVLIEAECDCADKEKIVAKIVEKAKSNLKKIAASAEQTSEIIRKLRSSASASVAAGFFVDDSYFSFNTSDLMGELEKLQQELFSHHEYEKVRDRYCSISIAMNLKGELSPAFRPRLHTGKKFNDPVFQKIHIDNIVIDCHWLFATKQMVRVKSKDALYQPIFSKKGDFDLNLAWEFANQKWTNQHRVVEMLRLSQFQQFQLLSLVSNEGKKLLASIESGKRENGKFIPSKLSYFETRLNEWCERDKRILKHRDVYLAVWRARQLLGDKASIPQLATLVRWMTGQPVKSDRTIREKEQKILRHILAV